MSQKNYTKKGMEKGLKGSAQSNTGGRASSLKSGAVKSPKAIMPKKEPRENTPKGILSRLNPLVWLFLTLLFFFFIVVQGLFPETYNTVASGFSDGYDALFEERVDMYDAVKAGDVQRVQELLAEGVNPNSIYNASASPFCLTIELNKPELLKLMLDQNIRWREDNNEKAPVRILSASAPEEMAEVIKLSIDSGLVVLQDLLYFASLDGNIPLLQFLMKTYSQFDINTTELESGVNLLASALTFNHVKSIDFLFENTSAVGRLLAFTDIAQNLSYDYHIPAMASENKAVRDSMFDSNANANISSADGTTPLMLAAMQGHVLAVEDVLARGAHIEALNADGNTALMLAAGAGQKSTVSALIAAGAQVNVANSTGWTPLMFAALAGDTEAVRLLLDHGAHIMARSNEGATTLNHAVVAGHMDVVQELLKRGADINVPDNDGWTPLMWASIQQGVPMIKLLLDNGANVHAVENNGFNVLRFGRNNLDDAVLELLEDFIDGQSTS